MFEQTGDFSSFWTRVRERRPRFVFVSFSGLFLVGFLCCICGFRLCKRFCEKLLFLAISCISVHSFYLFLGVNGRECNLVIWYLKAAIFCSMWWFEKKLMIVSVVIGFRNMPISRIMAFGLKIGQGS